MFVVAVGKGEEVISTVTREVTARGVSHGALSLIGAIEHCAVSVMPRDDPMDDIVTEYEQPFELTGTGEITASKVHIHVSLGGQDRTVVGHLHHATVGHWFVNVYVTPLG